MMTFDSTTTLHNLFEDEQIDLLRGPLFDLEPTGKPASFDFDRVDGMLLGLAIGDALGNTSESKTPAERRRQHGQINDYLPNRHAGGRAIGLPSDDSQLAFWTVEQLLADQGQLVPQNVLALFASRDVFGIGMAVEEALDNFRDGQPWHEAGVSSAGNGALMRIAPVLLPHLRTGGRALWADTALLAMLTHNERTSLSACLAFVAMLWELLDMTTPPDPLWWPQRYIELARPLEGDRHRLVSRDGDVSFTGPLWQRVALVEQAWRAGTGISAWYSGAFLLETMPWVIYLLMQHADDPEQAIVRAVNDTRDNDTIAAIVGAAVGALHGQRGLPQRWLDGLSGRTTHDDPGRIFELLELARRQFG